MRTKPFLPFTVLIAVFAAWCTLPVLGIGLGEVQDGQVAFEHWFLGVAEFVGGMTVLSFVLGAHSAFRTSSAVSPSDTFDELDRERALAAGPVPSPTVHDDSRDEAPAE